MTSRPPVFPRSIVPVMCQSASFALHLALLGGAAWTTPSLSFADALPEPRVSYAAQVFVAVDPADAEEAPPIEQNAIKDGPQIFPVVEGRAFSEQNGEYRGPDDGRWWNLGLGIAGFGGGPQNLEYSDKGPLPPPVSRRELTPHSAPEQNKPWTCPKSAGYQAAIFCRKTYLLKEP